MRPILLWLLCTHAVQACLESNHIFSPATNCLQCKDVAEVCQAERLWTRCYEKKIQSCTSKGRMGLILTLDASQESEQSPTLEHSVHIPQSAFRKSRGSENGTSTVLVTVLDSSYFKPTNRIRGRTLFPIPSGPRGQVLGGTVLVAHVLSGPMRNLPEPVTLTFKYGKKDVDGTCVFWEDDDDGNGFWSTYGCNTSKSDGKFVCRCNHLSFFAVLVNPVLSLSPKDVFHLTWMTSVGSALSAIFSVMGLVIFWCLSKRQPDRAVGLHAHLAAALLCLHSCFLLSRWRAAGVSGVSDPSCGALGLFLHWSLLAVVCWSALEGFHLYLLLVRVFNIYVRRYLLKMSALGWGVPTLIALVCGASGVYGKYTRELRNPDNGSSTMQLCWMSNSTGSLAVTYATTVAFPILVVLFNSCMLGLVVFKLWSLRGMGVGVGGGAKNAREKAKRLWKDCVTIVGLSCVLGLPFGLLTATYVSTPAVYVFTALNSLQGLFVFLWSLALLCKFRSDASSSSKDTSTQRMMTFNS
ncbi:adhesion G protein-coupled receptor G3-like [Stigmatopora nigra]